MKRFWLSLTVALTAVMMLSAAASACDKEGKKKDCPFKSGKAKWMLTELEGKGFVANLVLSGTAEENTQMVEKIQGKIAKCSSGKCECKHKGHCPFGIEGLTYDVKKTDAGLEVTVTGGTPDAQGQFKQLMEAKIAGKFKHGCKGDGSCKGDCPHKKDGACGCKDKQDGECGCKGECKGDCKGDCPHKKAEEATCGCGKKKSECGGK